MKEIELVLKEKYISENKEICKTITKVIQENQIVLLVAPQGTGKTMYLRNLMKQYKTLLTAPTLSLAEQNEKEFNLKTARGRTEYTFSWCKSCIFDDDIRNTSTTFSSAEGFLLADFLDSFDLVVADEIHKLVQYSTFSFSNVVSIVKTLDRAVELGKKVLLITATPELVHCLKGFYFKKEIDTCIYIKKEMKYFSKCICMHNLDRHNVLLNHIRQNHRQGNFQIVLFNSSKGIADIANELNSNNIKAISCTSKDYRENKKMRSIIKNIKNGKYLGYDVLLTTSWIDVGLNFKGTNISHIYCIFDSFYRRGDFTIIRQFMARTRNSKPILYINHPCLTENEKRLKEHYDLINRDKQLFNDLEKLAKSTLDKVEMGLLQTTNNLTNVFYGLYKIENQEQSVKYEYSSLTLRYQLYKLWEKVCVYDYNALGIAELLNAQVTDISMGATENSRYYHSIQDLLDSWYKTEYRFTIDELCNQIRELSYGIVNISRPSNYVRNYGYIIKRSNTTRWLEKA